MAAVVAGFSSQSQANPLPIRGDVHVAVGEVTTDGGDYAAGGFELAASLFDLDTIDHIQVGHSSAAGVTARFVKSTGKLFVWDEDNASGIEAEHAAAAISASFPVTVWGRKAD